MHAAIHRKWLCLASISQPRDCIRFGFSDSRQDLTHSLSSIVRQSKKQRIGNTICISFSNCGNVFVCACVHVFVCTHISVKRISFRNFCFFDRISWLPRFFLLLTTERKEKDWPRTRNAVWQLAACTR